MATFIETDCTVTFHGKEFTSGGAVVTPAHCIAYLGANGVLLDWHGTKIGTYRITSTWETPGSCMSSHMHQVEARVDGVTYTGRSAGVGMSFSGKRKAGGQP